MFAFRKGREVVCTMSGTLQDPKPGLIPAGSRYAGTHISQARAAAGYKALYILSSRMGLVSEKMGVPRYDHIPLQNEREVDALAARVARQIRDEKIRTIFYFYEPANPEWEPYTQVLVKIAGLGVVGTIFMELPTIKEAMEMLPQAADAPALA